MKRSIVLSAVIAILISAQAFSSTPDKLKNQAKVMNTLGSLPVYFIENQGQLDEEVAYYVKGSEKDLYFTAGGITIVLKSQEGDEVKRWTVKLEFVDANPDAKPVGQEQQKAVFSYFKGQPEDWKTGCPSYGRIVYNNLWPGIDLRYLGDAQHLKYEFVVKPGADPAQIRIACRGAGAVSIKDTGALEVKTPYGSFEDGAPLAYQEIAGQKKDVAMQYQVGGRTGEGTFTYGFKLGTFDPTRELILDPSILLYCGYIGGGGYEYVRGIAVDNQNRALVTGITDSKAASFPVKVGPILLNQGKRDAFVARLSKDGTELEYCGYIGGEGYESGGRIVVDNLGNAFVMGSTDSSEATFPVKIGPDLTYNGGSKDVFVAGVNAFGTDLLFCGYIGGSEYDYGNGIAMDGDEDIYIAGLTRSDESSFPVKVGPDLTFNSTLVDVEDAFVAKVKSDASGLEFCGYIGGEKYDWASGISVDDEGCVYITGGTGSDESSFPVKIGPDLTYNGTKPVYIDAFVAKVKSDASGLEYCGYIGGMDREGGEAIAVDGQGRAYIAGFTRSDESSFPVIVGPDLTYNGHDNDCFVARVNAQGTDLEYCGYIGGSADEFCSDIAVDSKGRAYVVGGTESAPGKFPVKIGPDLFRHEKIDSFIARVNAQGNDLDHCGYIGGDDNDNCGSIALDERYGHILVGGGTSSSENKGFPVKIGPDLTFNGNSDAFVAMMPFLSLSMDTYSLPETGGSVNFLLDAMGDNANRNYILLAGVSGIDPGHPLPGGMAILPINWDIFTDVVISLINTSVFSSFIGTLDASGEATAQLNAPALPQGYVGLVISFAFALNNPFDYVSNPMWVVVVP